MSGQNAEHNGPGAHHAVAQIKARRASLGRRVLDPRRACPGYTLFAPLTGDRTVILIDLLGEMVHTWVLPYPPGLYHYLTEAGTLLDNGKLLDRPERFISQQPWKGGAVLEVDWHGQVLWEVRHPDHHHDGRPDADAGHPHLLAELHHRGRAQPLIAPR